MTTYTAPLNVRGIIDPSDSSPDTTVGQVTSSQTATVTFEDTTATTLFTLPENSQILEFTVDVTTAFDAGTTNVVDVGTAADPDAYVDNADVSSAGRILGSATATVLPNYAASTSRVEVQALYTPSGTAATAGAASVTVEYVVRTELPF
jgi:hypothetical protein